MRETPSKNIIQPVQFFLPYHLAGLPVIDLQNFKNSENGAYMIIFWPLAHLSAISYRPIKIPTWADFEEK